MRIKVGTFNLNNLFSRFNFKADLADAEVVEFEGHTTFTLDGEAITKREFNGKLVNGKRAEERAILAQRIRDMDVDVLAVQEVEDLDTLRAFALEDLQGLYPHVSLVEGNDDRLIDVGLLSKLPLGPVTSWRHATHPDVPDEPVFSRDLAQVEVMDAQRTRVLFTIFNNHLKSQLILDGDPENQQQLNDELRRRQTATIANVVRSRFAPGAAYIIVGDMNDTPDSAQLEPIRALEAVAGLSDARETRAFHDPAGDPTTKCWTHRFKQGDGPAKFELFDQIWLSPSLAPALKTQ